jgi:hypothetical protein
LLSRLSCSYPAFSACCTASSPCLPASSHFCTASPARCPLFLCFLFRLFCKLSCLTCSLLSCCLVSAVHCPNSSPAILPLLLSIQTLLLQSCLFSLLSCLFTFLHSLSCSLSFLLLVSVQTFLPAVLSHLLTAQLLTV